MIAVEVECDAMKLGEEDHCDFIVAHPNQVEHFVRYYSEHQRTRRDPSETHLELLAKTRSLRSRTRPGMGNWLKKIIERETALVIPQAEATGQVIGAPKPKEEEAGTPTSEDDSVVKSESRKGGSKSSIKRSRQGSSAGQTSSATPTLAPSSSKKIRPPLVSTSRKSLDISRGSTDSATSANSSASDDKAKAREHHVQMSPHDTKSKLSPEDPKPNLSKSDRSDRKESIEEKPLSKSEATKK